ncbi:hypothetical protein Tco_1039082 [Tanacetum coccineum]
MSFILDQEEKLRQLEEYMSTIGRDFMQLSLEVVKKLKEEIRIKENNSKRIQKITRKSSPIDNEKMYKARKKYEGQSSRNFFDSINTDAVILSHWANLFQMDAPVYRELVWVFFASFEFDSIPSRYDPEHVGVSFRLGGESKMMFLLELGWRVGLYSKEQSRIARSFGLLTNAMVDALCVEPRAHVFNKRSLISIRVVMDLGGGTCCWPATRQVGEEDEVEEAAEEGAGGSANVYRNMSRGDWQVCQGQWMDQQDGRWGQVETWMTRQTDQANWMYDHIVCHFQYFFTHDNLHPHLQIDPFPGREADYHPYGYTGKMPPGYEY